MSHRLFLADDRATYDFENGGIRRDNVRMALVADELVWELFRLEKEKTELLNTVPGINVQLIDLEPKTRARCLRLDSELSSLVGELGMRYTPRNTPCFCGSGERFKNCCGA